MFLDFGLFFYPQYTITQKIYIKRTESDNIVPSNTWEVTSPSVFNVSQHFRHISVKAVGNPRPSMSLHLDCGALTTTTTESPRPDPYKVKYM